jgi:hypothetical protein
MAVWQRQFLEYHPVVGLWYVPNLRVRIPHEGGSYALATNSVGMRANREYSRSRERSAVRILLLGDSFSAGDGVNNEDRFSDVLERQHPGLEVLNFGLAGSGTDQQILVFECIAKLFQADAFILAPWIGNIIRNRARFRSCTDRATGQMWYIPKPYFRMRDGQLLLEHQPVPRERYRATEIPAHELDGVDYKYQNLRWRRFVNGHLKGAKESIQRLVRWQPYSEYSSASNYSWVLMRAIIERFLKSVEPKPVFLLPLPSYHYIENDLEPIYQQRFREIEKDFDFVRTLDVLPNFRRLGQKDRRLCRFESDTHYTPLAHGIVAKTISSELVCSSAPIRLKFAQRGLRPCP